MAQVAPNTPSSSPNTPNNPNWQMMAMQAGVSRMLAAGTLAVDAGNKLPPRRNEDRKEYNEVLRPTEVYAIPDIHGDIVALKNSLKSLGLINEQDDYIGGKCVVQFLGDYIDRGTTNLEVFDYLIEFKKQVEAAEGQVSFLLGNHEGMLLAAAADLEDYRGFYLNPNNGGDTLYREVRDKYQLTREEDVWAKIRELFLEEGGKYTEFIDSMQIVNQVDDVLYVHAGLSPAWAGVFEKKGVEGVNQFGRFATQLRGGKGADFHAVFNEKGPAWIRYDTYKKEQFGGKTFSSPMSDADIEMICRALKKRGVNAVVIGHDNRAMGPKLNERFKKYGIKFVESDTMMSSGFASLLTAYSVDEHGEGGVEIDTQGNIKGHSRFGNSIIHQEPISQSKVA